MAGLHGDRFPCAAIAIQDRPGNTLACVFYPFITGLRHRRSMSVRGRYWTRDHRELAMRRPAPIDARRYRDRVPPFKITGRKRRTCRWWKGYRWPDGRARCLQKFATNLYRLSRDRSA